MGAEKLTKVLEEELSEALERDRISRTERDVILALYRRSSLDEVAKLIPNLDVSDAYR